MGIHRLKILSVVVRQPWVWMQDLSLASCVTVVRLASFMSLLICEVGIISFTSQYHEGVSEGTVALPYWVSSKGGYYNFMIVNTQRKVVPEPPSLLASQDSFATGLSAWGLWPVSSYCCCRWLPHVAQPRRSLCPQGGAGFKSSAAGGSPSTLLGVTKGTKLDQPQRVAHRNGTIRKPMSYSFIHSAVRLSPHYSRIDKKRNLFLDIQKIKGEPNNPGFSPLEFSMSWDMEIERPDS